MGTTIASTTAGNTMAAIVIAGYIKHEHNKYGRGTPKACLYCISIRIFTKSSVSYSAFEIEPAQALTMI